MKVNLSLVLDEKCEIRLDLMKNIELKEVDKYTTSKNNHHDIRNDYQKEIEDYLNLNKSFIDTFKKESNKKGSIVITLEDEHNKYRKLRVLYNKNINKLDTDNLIDRIIETLKNLKDIKKTLKLIEKYRHLMFNSPFEINNINMAKYKFRESKFITNIDVQTKNIKNLNNDLLLLVKNKFVSLNKGSEKQQDICYYYLRIIDSYIEKNFKVFTTREILNTNLGKIKINVNEVIKDDNKVINKEIHKFNGQKMVIEDDGQFSIFSDELEYKDIRMRISDIDYENNYYDNEEDIIKHGKH